MPKKKTWLEVKTAMEAVLGFDYNIIGSYLGNKEKIEVYHKICGKSYFPTPKDVKAGKSTCSNCNGSDAKYGVTYLTKAQQDLFVYPSDIETKKSKDRIQVTCKICNYTFFTELSKIRGGRGCAKCNGTNRFTHDEFIIKFNSVRFMDAKEYIFVSNYNGNGKIIKVKHLECGTIFQTSPDKLLTRSKKCPTCYSISTGAKAVLIIANKLNLEVITEYKFEDLPNRSFDFYFPSINLIMEYDGIQHFLDKSKMHPSNIHYEALFDSMIRDWEKNNYMREISQLKFIRINESHLEETKLTQMFNEIIDDIAVPSVINKNGIYYSHNREVINEEVYYTLCNPNYFEQLGSVV
jgi:hypothetical protein